MFEYHDTLHRKYIENMVLDTLIRGSMIALRCIFVFVPFNFTFAAGSDRSPHFPAPPPRLYRDSGPPLPLVLQPLLLSPLHLRLVLSHRLRVVLQLCLHLSQRLLRASDQTLARTQHISRHRPVKCMTVFKATKSLCFTHVYL